MTSGANADTVALAPAIVLVEPQLGENVGMVARAMLNCGLEDLRLVRPREPWPNEKAVASAAGADHVLTQARIFGSTLEAVADLERLYATTARRRDMTKLVFTPRAAATDMWVRARTQTRLGLMFGKEASGLHNDDVALADAIVTVRLNPAFSSLNLGMAVLIVAYEWLSGGLLPAEEATVWMPSETRPAAKAELVAMFEHLEAELNRCGFLRVAEKRQLVIRNLRNLFGRADLTEQEVRTLRGVIACLASGPRRGSA